MQQRETEEPIKIDNYQVWAQQANVNSQDLDKPADLLKLTLHVFASH